MQYPGFKLIFICSLVVLFSCTRVNDFFSPPTPREKYEREFEEESPRYEAWNKAFEEGLNDSLKITLPYREVGYFFPGATSVYSYNVELDQGELFQLEITTDTSDTRVFIDFYRNTADDSLHFDFEKRTEPTDRNFQYEVEKSAIYKVIIQPELEAETPFYFTLVRRPTLQFPVAGRGNKDIQSFWGASRDMGARSHEGIDIFAPRGTPVVAATDGRITFVGERGLGGKQVWMRTGFLGGYSLYYAHLDSIAASAAQSVNAGDTLGFVGNSGNARTTPPHLHFGIYRTMGAVDPLAYVFKEESELSPLEPFEEWKKQLVVHSARANLRDAASMQGEKIGEASRGDTLLIMGKTDDWWHIKTQNQLKAFIHESLVE